MWKSGKRREGTTAARESERVREEREKSQNFCLEKGFHL